MKKIKLFLAALLAIVGASSVVAQTKQAYAVVTSNNEAQTLTVCKGEDESTSIPIYGLYTDVENTTGQMVYPAEMLANMKGSKISKLTFYTFASYAEETGHEDYVDCVIQFENVKLQLSLKEIEENGFSEATAFTGATVVATAVPAKGDKELVFTFDEPFEYKGGNLLVEVKVIEAGSWKTTYFWGEKDEDSELKNSFYYFQTAWGTNTTEIDNFLPAASFDYENEAQTLTFYYDGNKPTTGTVYPIPWTENSPGWYESQNNVTTVTFDESFKDYDGLTTTRNMFNQFGKLETINHLEYLNTENVKDMANMFWFCEKLKTLDVSNFNTEKVTDMSSMFRNCKSLETLDLSNFNTAKVTTMNAMFSESEALETIYCNDDWATMNENQSSLNSSGMFYWCIKLKGAVAYDYGTTKDDVSMANPTQGFFTAREAYAIAKLNHPEDQSDESRTLTFYYDNMKAQRSAGVSSTYVYSIPWTGTQPQWTNSGVAGIITAADFDPSFADYKGLTSTHRMFYEMTNLKTIDNLKYLNTQNVTDMSEMFMGCQNENLTELDVSNFNTAKVTDMNNMFYMCTHVEALDVSKFNTAKVTNMNGMFSNCYKVEELDLSNFDTKNVTDMNCMFFCCYALKSLDLSNFDTGNVTDMNSMFGNCYALKSLNVSSFDTRNVTNMKNMFSGCTVLPSLDVSSFDTGNVTDMSFMFKSCSTLTSLDLSSFDTKNVTTMRDMFSSCSSLESLDLSSFDTKNVTMMGSMFADCKNLPMLDVSSFNVESVTNMSAMFMNCESLTTIFCLDDWKEMCETEDLNYMFSGCNVLKGVVPYNRNNSNDIDYANPTTGYFAPFYDLTVTEAGMATLYLGFQAEIPEDVNAYLCYAEDLTGNKPYALAHKFEDSYLPKETAVFVTAEPGTYRFKYYYVEPGQVINFISDFLDGNILTGTLEEMPVEPHSVLTLGYSNQTDDLGFWWYTGTTIPANRAYIPGDKLPAEVKGIRLLFDEETGIATTNLMNQTNEADAWYTIDGRKLEGKPQQRGLYINNGKKIMVK